MRQIKFRGFSMVANRWIYGAYIPCTETVATIFSEDSVRNGVFPQSIGQYTGFKDKNGVEIYEGDILSCLVNVDDEVIQSKTQVFWGEKEGCWMLDNSYSQDKSYGDPLCEELSTDHFEVIGNIYENQTK